MALFFTWSNEYEIGNYLIDRQHQGLFDIINTLHTGREDAQVQKQCFLELRDYTVKHFTTEEEAMRVYNYPTEKLEAHKREHRHFTEKINAFCRATEDGETIIMESVMTYLRNWLTHHVLKVDGDLVHYMSSPN